MGKVSNGGQHQDKNACIPTMWPPRQISARLHCIMKVSSVCNSGHGGISATPTTQTLDTVFYGLKLCYGQSHCDGSHVDHVLAMSPCSACALVQTYSQLVGGGGSRQVVRATVFAIIGH